MQTTLSRTEAAAHIGVSTRTLDAWHTRGVLRSHPQERLLLQKGRTRRCYYLSEIDALAARDESVRASIDAAALRREEVTP